MDREDRRAERDAAKLHSAAKLAFKKFLIQIEEANVDMSNCNGTMKSLDEDFKNVIRKIDRYTEVTGEPMENVLIDDTYIVMVDQCAVWRQKIYKRQSHLYTKDKSDEADKK